MKKMSEQAKKMAMYYGGIVLIGAGIATCCTLSAWGIVPAFVGIGIIVDVFI